MSFLLTQLKIQNVRNLSDLSLSLGACNVFVGDNGSGKTSLFESLFLLARGKSFRHFESKRYITHGAERCTVWAMTNTGERFAIAKHKSPDRPSQLRHNDLPIKNQATLTQLLPSVLIDPSGMHILEDGTATRRQLIDWLCFHCQPLFYDHWLAYQRQLKQRNALLKIAQNAQNPTPFIAQIHAIDEILIKYANALHHDRQTVFDAWQPHFEECLAQLLPQYQNAIRLTLLAGFDQKKSLKDHLSERLAQDLEQGYTRVGVHRADLSIALHGMADGSAKEQAVNVLSRGEKKLLIVALKLSGLALLDPANPPMVLIDDFDSELDKNARTRLLSLLKDKPYQVFINSVNADIVNELTPIWGEKGRGVVVYDLQNGQIVP